jgi:hypothetical protein
MRLVYFEDFEDTQTGWSRNTTTPCGGTNKILGGFGEVARFTVSKDFAVPTPHTEVMVRLIFFALDSWDDERAFADVGESGSGLRRRCWRANPLLAHAFNDICGHSGYADQTYAVECRAPHTGGNVTIWIGSDLDESPITESWGVDNLEIWIR